MDKTEAVSAPEAAGATVEHHHRWFLACMRRRAENQGAWLPVQAWFEMSGVCVQDLCPVFDVKHVVMLRLLEDEWLNSAAFIFVIFFLISDELGIMTEVRGTS